MSFGDITGSTTRSGYGNTSLLQERCQKTTVVRGTITAGGIVEATAESSCECPPDKSDIPPCPETQGTTNGTSSETRGWGGKTGIYYINTTKHEDGQPDEFCAERESYDTGLCTPSRHGGVDTYNSATTCVCDDGEGSSHLDDEIPNNMHNTHHQIREYIVDGAPGITAVDADCGKCDGSPWVK